MEGIFGENRKMTPRALLANFSVLSLQVQL